MNLLTLFFSELKYRWRGSLIAACAVAVAVISVTTVLHLLSDFDTQTQGKVLALQERSQVRMDALENEARVFAKSLGFNILVYHEGQDLATFHAHDVNTHYLTTEQAQKLADANFPLLNHLLPFLRHRYALPAFDGEVIIAGIEGEIYIKRKFQAPLEVRVEPGQVQLGSSVASKLDKKIGDSIQVDDKFYQVTHLRDQLGTKDDIMIFMNLGDAQRLLGLPGKLSGILALSCDCAAGDMVPIRKELKKLIPNADVVEFAIQARARERARRAIKQAAQAEISDILTARMELRSQLNQFSLLFAGVIVGASALLLIFLYSHNVKERRHEIAILRTLGVRLWKIVLIFVAKSFLLALFGSVGGYFGGLALSRQLTRAAHGVIPFDSLLLLILFAVSASVSIVASLIPVFVAAQREPGFVLNEEG